MELHASTKIQPSISEKPIDISFKSVIQREYISKGLQERLQSANALLIPYEGYIDKPDLIYFPSGTTELYQYLRERQTEDFKVEICIEDKDYKELVLHSDWLNIAKIVVELLVAPLIVNYIYDYLKQNLGKGIADTNVRSKLTVIDKPNEQQVEYSYVGPADEYRDVMIKAIPKLGLQSPQPPVKTKRRRHKKGKKQTKK